MKPTNVKKCDWLKYNVFFVIEHFLGRNLFLKFFGKLEKKLWDSLDKYATECGHKNQFIIEEFNEPSEYPEDLWHPYNVRVFRGAAKDWICTKKWTFEHFSDVYGEKEVTLYNNVGLKDKESDQNFETITLKQYIKMLRSGSKKYLKFSRMIHQESDLYTDFNMNWMQKFQFGGKFKNMFFLFMGAKNTFTPIHNGLPATLFVQIQGQKKWWFAPTSDRIFMHVPAERRNYFYTHANPEELQDPQFPLLKHANFKELTLNEGDVLWFPPLVWHQVLNTTDSIGVAYKFFHLPSGFTSSKILTTLFFLSTRPLLIKSVIMGKINKVDYIFTNPQN